MVRNLGLSLFVLSAICSNISSAFAEQCLDCKRDVVPFTMPTCTPAPVCPSGLNLSDIVVQLTPTAASISQLSARFGDNDNNPNTREVFSNDHANDRPITFSGAFNGINLSGYSGLTVEYAPAISNPVSVVSQYGAQELLEECNASNGILASGSGRTWYTPNVYSNITPDGSTVPLCSQYWGLGNHNSNRAHRRTWTISQNIGVATIKSGGLTCGQVNIKAEGNYVTHYIVYYRSWPTGTSPVSLAMSGKMVKDNYSLVEFKLSESQKSEKILWLGSAESPLLVWDPEAKGIVKDGKDLFGSWTFGKEWRDGYKALASLDKDTNKILEKSELAGIRLWFDLNRDAKVQEREIRDLSDYGISALNTEWNVEEKNELLGTSIFKSSKGYMSVKDGKEVWGESFDWFVPTEYKASTIADNISALESKDFKVLAWKEKPEYEGNKVNGYFAWKKEGESLLGKFYTATVFKTQEGERLCGLMTYNLNGKFKGEDKLEFSTEDHIPVNFSTTIDSRGNMTGGEIQTDPGSPPHEWEVVQDFKGLPCFDLLQQ